MVSLTVSAPSGSELRFSGPVTGQRYRWAVEDGDTVAVDEADVPGLLELTFKRGRDCGCSGNVPVAQGNNDTVHYFTQATG